MFRNRIHTDPFIWRAEATVELCEIGEIMAEILSKYAIRKRKFSKSSWLLFINAAVDTNIEIQLLRLENIISESTKF